MLNGINTNPAMLWANTNKQAAGKPQNANFSVSSKELAPIRLDGNALVSAAMRLPGGGMMNASVYKSANYTDDNPVMLVKGTDVDGKLFEVEINANNVDPRNASFVEMFALDGYFAANGQQVGAARAAGSAMVTQELSGNIPALGNAFTQFNFLPPLQDAKEVQRFHGNWEAFWHLQHVIDSLMGHIR